MAHGKPLGEALRAAALGQRVGPDVGPSQASAAEQPYQCTTAEVIGDQSTEAYDVSNGKKWCDGLNRRLHGAGLHAAAERLVSEQLNFFSLELTSGAVSTSIPRTRSDTLPASALLFDTEQELRTWLAIEGNAKYRGSVVKVPGVLKDGEAHIVWAVLVGAA